MSSENDRVWNFGPVYVAKGDDSAPDILMLRSGRALTAAPCMTVVDPLPRVGSPIRLQVDIPGVFTLNVKHVVLWDDTPATVAAALAAAINDGAGNPDNVPLLIAAGVIAGNTPGQPQFAVTNPKNGKDVVTLSDTSDLASPVFSPSRVSGNHAWDAGPNLPLGKMPIDPVTGKGIAPPGGSNIGQIIFEGWALNGVSDLQYLTISCNVINPETGEAELAVYTGNTKQKLLSLSPYGLYVLGVKLA